MQLDGKAESAAIGVIAKAAKSRGNADVAVDIG